MKSITSLEQCDTGKGWNKIILPLLDVCNSRGVSVAQVKEKFGTLRFYVDGADDDLYNLINKAEAESSRTCEVCGEPGASTNYGWIKTLCPLHAKEREDQWKARQEKRNKG
jgi:hypothetical protein